MLFQPISVLICVAVTLFFVRRLIKLSLLIIERCYQLYIHFSRLTPCVDVIIVTISVNFDVSAQLLDAICICTYI
jgi:hypothetical protein